MLGHIHNSCFLTISKSKCCNQLHHTSSLQQARERARVQWYAENQN